ncbi:Clusterin-associated protein-1 like protein [Aduncisulcus paluster]|uniref:Clusterin-associated protein-1 like protein n=1 Tax=Aduncisulcus paluster TaxID=2918883 RepID=A0ABQ5KG26_9EUKA|nr:Clusterin-associated protein-1 like protein [Aduncisulcus paluster]
MKDLLCFLLKKYSASHVIPEDISTEDDRIFFVTTAVQLIASKLHLRLSPKSLYRSDKNCVKELIKLSEPLYKALMMTESVSKDIITLRDGYKTGGEEHSLVYPSPMDIERARVLSSEITKDSANINNLLKETQETEAALSRSLTKHTDYATVQSVIKLRIQSLEMSTKRDEEEILSAKRDLEELQSRLQHRTTELSRASERLQTLRCVKAPYADELIGVQRELSKLHSEYTMKFMALQGLEDDMRLQEEEEGKKRMNANKELLMIRKQVRAEQMDMFTHVADVPASDFGMIVVNDDRDDFHLDDDDEKPLNYPDFDDHEERKGLMRESESGRTRLERRRDMPAMAELDEFTMPETKVQGTLFDDDMGDVDYDDANAYQPDGFGPGLDESIGNALLDDADDSF